MSAKFMHVFTDENPELQKQIGCMSGIFQMFDHHHLITRRRLTAHSHKRLPSDHGLMNISVVGSERNASSPQIAREKNLSKSMYENQRVSMESSRTSFSSSSCSSFSSLECKSTQQDFPIFDRAIFQERSLKTSPRLKNSVNDTRIICEPRNNLPNASVQSTRQSLDFQEVVKDSIYRGSRGLSVKTSTKEDVKKHVLKHRDSPRPAYMIGGIDSKPRMPMDWYFSEAGEPPRSSFEAKDVQFNPVLRESRFSYDGREISRTSLDSGEHRKPTSRLRELPRLSLDSREGSLKNSNFESKPNSSLKDLDRRSMNQVSADSNVHLGLGIQKRSSSVVAKLMGLEAMPNLSLAAQEPMELAKTHTQIDCASYGSLNFILKSADAIQDSKKDQVSRSPTPVTPQLIKPHSVMKPISNSRMPIEPAPWKQPDRVHVPQKAFGNQEAHLKQRPESVYSEFEKRLKELKFRQSNKDLRALKQILDAMQAKGVLETKKAEEHSEVSVHKSHCNQTPTRGDQNFKSANVRRLQISHPVPTLMKGNNSPKALESPIVIMKPAKSVNRSGFYASSAIPLEGLSGLRKLRTADHMDKRKASAKEQIPKASSRELSNQTLLSTIKNSINKSEENSSQRTRSRMVQYSYKPQKSPRENCGSSVKTPSSLSPRLQQRKHETERKLCRSPPSESKKPQKPYVNKQPSELVSPRGKLRRKSTKVQENDDQLSESSETRNSSQQGDEISLRSDSNIVPASQVDVDRSSEMNLAFLHQGSPRTSEKAANNSSSVLRKKYSLNLNEEVSTTEPVAVASEQPSPISVLDASFYQDDLPPSPLNKSSDAFKDDDFRASDEHWNLVSRPNAALPISHKKLESIQKLVQKLSELTSSDGGSPTTDHIASLCESQNPDHRYVSEILLASGLLLNDLSDELMSPMPLQLHPSGQLINPDLFLVLEQRKSGCLSEHETVHKSTLQPKPDPGKLHRKLVFDVVNEIIIQKLELTSRDRSIDLLHQAKKLPRRFPSGQRLLRELCLEIEQLRPESSRGDSINEDNSIGGENVLCKLEGWADFGREVPGVVLGIERSIFKDLIDEVLSSEAASSLQSKLSRRLFSK